MFETCNKKVGQVLTLLITWEQPIVVDLTYRSDGPRYMGDAGRWDGTISAVQFKAAAAQLVLKCEERCLGSSQVWRWQEAPSAALAAFSDKAAGYVVLENVLVPSHPISKANDVEENAKDEDRSSYGDDATLVSDSSDYGCHLYTFHIVYSDSYRVPVMFFRGYSPDGSPLLWDEVLQDLPGTAHTADDQSRWTFVTQQEHPYLQRPWFSLHPCGTASMLALMFSESKRELQSSHPDEHCNGQSSHKDSPIQLGPVDFSTADKRQYLMSWLSVIGPILGLKVPHALFS